MKTLLISLEKRIDQLLSEVNYTGHRLQHLPIFHNFLKKELKPWQFIPWDKKNNCPLEKPKNYDDWINGKIQMTFGNKYNKYQQAESEVLFENCYAEKVNDYYIIKDEFGMTLWLSWNESKTISDLVGKGIYLTPEGKKQSGL